MTSSKARLTILSGPSQGRVFDLDGSPVLLGRLPTPECAIDLRTERVSSRHAEISLVKGRWILRDLQSLNGTSVDGVRIPEAELLSGTAILFADVEARFELVPSSSGQPPRSSPSPISRGLGRGEGALLPRVMPDAALAPAPQPAISPRKRNSSIALPRPAPLPHPEAPSPPPKGKLPTGDGAPLPRPVPAAAPPAPKVEVSRPVPPPSPSNEAMQGLLARQTQIRGMAEFLKRGDTATAGYLEELDFQVAQMREALARPDSGEATVALARLLEEGAFTESLRCLKEVLEAQRSVLDSLVELSKRE